MKKFLLLQVVFIICTHPGTAQINEPLLDSVVHYRYIGESDSLVSPKRLYQYNSDGQLLQYEWLIWSNANWKVYLSQRKTYDSSGNLTLQVDHAIQEQGLGYPYVKHEWENDLQGRPLIKTKYYKNAYEDPWTPHGRAQYKHSQDGKLVQLLYFTWNMEFEDWSPNQLYTYNYNSFGLETERLISGWNGTTNRWDIYRKNVKTYSAEGVILSDYNFNWKPYEGVWERKYDFWIEYDSLGRISKEMKSNIGSSQLTEYFYDSVGNYNILVASSPPWIGNYKPHLKFEITVDSLDQRIKDVLYKIIDSTWTPYSKTERIFKSYGNLSRESTYRWYEGASDWELTGRDYYYYNTISTSAPIIDDKSIKIFPNPTSGLINITGLNQPAEVNVYSIQGQLLKSEYQVESLIDISDLEAGVYVMIIVVGDDVDKKVIVKR